MPTVASSRGRIGIPRLRVLLRCLNAKGHSIIKFSQHVGSPVHPNPLLPFTWVIGDPTGTTFPYVKTVVKNASEISR